MKLLRNIVYSISMKREREGERRERDKRKRGKGGERGRQEIKKTKMRQHYLEVLSLYHLVSMTTSL